MTMTKRAFPNWDELYGAQAVEGLPWFYAGLDPDLEHALSAQSVARGRVLDLGTGPGTQALALAERGYAVVGSDVSLKAVEQARERAAAREQARTRSPSRKLEIEFVQDDVLDSKLESTFDAVFDRGCFHVMAPGDRARYAETLASLVKPQGFFFLKCFSSEQPGDVGPYRLTLSELEATFTAAFEILSAERTVYQGTLDPLPIAWFCTLRRR
jgi:SAM-dependent methyltransferase